MEKTFGGQRLGSGNKMKVELHNYERSTHNLGYLWRSTMAAGTLVPFINEIALPGDTFDIYLKCDVKTHPTIGPLFGSYKVQLDVFQCPIRLYNSLLHNNALGIGLEMQKVKLPQISWSIQNIDDPENLPDIDNCQTNPSSLLAYLGIRGGGINTTGSSQTRYFNALDILSYWDVVKNYYANKQEELGVVLHTPSDVINETVDRVSRDRGNVTIPESASPGVTVEMLNADIFTVAYTGATPKALDIIFNTQQWDEQSLEALCTGNVVDLGTELSGVFDYGRWGYITILSWRYRTTTDVGNGKPKIATFPLSNIDDMRTAILAYSSKTVPFVINETIDIPPYNWLTDAPNGIYNTLSSQEGLALKTYQSDLFNNWVQTEWIDGTNGINAITAIDTSGGSFTIDTLLLSRKVYDMLNRIAVSGGTYDDWLDAVYAHDRYVRAETPMFMGGLSSELVFQEVISNSQSADQPLGTLAGRGIMAKGQKGGHIVIKVDEPSVIMALVSLTPRIDYSQGNKWHTQLQTMNDLHKPALDEIGFQELITEQMAWWDTKYDGVWVRKSAGKQPAWINYMTNVNVVRGNFAIAKNEMFMTLNRRYEYDETAGIKDLTTYIDPSKYNNIFAETALDAQNFWVQIAVDITARRKMSAKVMPNL